MKKIMLMTVILTVTVFTYGQKSIDNLFDKYAGKDGFTTVTINGGLLKLAHLFSNDDDKEALPSDINMIRVLAQEDKTMRIENFYDVVMKDFDLSNYDEFMRVKNSKEDLRMLVRSNGNRFKELLFVVGGDDNAVIQIKGNITYDEAKKLSKDAEENHGLNLKQ